MEKRLRLIWNWWAPGRASSALLLSGFWSCILFWVTLLDVACSQKHHTAEFWGELFCTKPSFTRCWIFWLVMFSSFPCFPWYRCSIIVGMWKWSLFHIDKIKGFEFVYKSLWVSPPIANWFWNGTSFELICMTRLFNANQYKLWHGIRAGCAILICHRLRLIKIVCMCCALLVAYMWGRVGMWKWGLFHIDKIKGFELVYKLVS